MLCLFCPAGIISQEIERMARRYPAMSTLAADYAVPLLGWLTMELGMSLAEMRNVSKQRRETCPCLCPYHVQSNTLPAPNRLYVVSIGAYESNAFLPNARLCSFISNVTKCH